MFIKITGTKEILYINTASIKTVIIKDNIAHIDADHHEPYSIDIDTTSANRLERMFDELI